MIQKKKKIEKANTPDAFKRNWPDIVEAKTPNAIALIRPAKSYMMKQLHIAYAPTTETLPAVLVVSHPHRYPSWDEMVWIRYQLCPEIKDMAFILPPLDKYINHTGGRGKYTFTMEEVERRVDY